MRLQGLGPGQRPEKRRQTRTSGRVSGRESRGRWWDSYGQVGDRGPGYVAEHLRRRRIPDEDRHADRVIGARREVAATRAEAVALDRGWRPYLSGRRRWIA